MAIGHTDNKVRNQGTGNVSFTGDSLDDHSA